jgi:multidrug efflux pump subunit AcrB
MNLVKASLRHPQVVYVLTLLACIGGIVSLLDMPRREDPATTIRRGLVLAAYPGATAEQVEEQVTGRVEELLFGYAEVRKPKTVSTSMVGGMIIDVVLEDDVTDADRFWSKLRHDLNELRFTELPQGVLGPIVNANFGDVIAVLLAVRGERYGYRELQGYLESLEAELIRLPAVSQIRRIGEQDEKIYVTSTMQRLVQYGITPLNIIGALQQQNVIASAGAFDTDEARVPLRTSGLYQTEDQIRRQIVGASPTGSPIYLGDFADVERAYADPEFLVRANGTPALMLTLEMRLGFNIVEFGEEIDATIERMRSELPPDLEIVYVADQPKVVEERIGHFLGEFGVALLAVVAATLILLPLQVATIAAVAIPVTVLVTFGILQAMGIELHQVSLAGLIIVLGMVVDDAIVIADNYVELLDEGVSRDEAAWRSASDLAVPVAAATLTIIASFLPLTLVGGSQGEWLYSLPVTVTLALGTSYLVAMFLTPVLCRRFIKKGLHSSGEPVPGEKKKKRGLLDLMQGVYDRTIVSAMRRKRLSMAFGIGAVAAGALLGSLVPQSFFPPAERDQFAINVWMPEGTRLEATDAVVRRIEEELAADPDVVGYASFVGQGGPRFFYAFEPAFPRPNVAQFIIQSTSVDATPDVVRRMRDALPGAVPRAEVDVQALTQGNPMWAPIEVRISGNDLSTLRGLADRVRRIFEETPGSFMVRQNFREDIYTLEIDLQPDVASRMGMTSTIVSNSLAGTFMGMPVSTFWEGDHAVDIVLRLDESHRQSVEDLASTYMVSEAARVPLRGIADVRPVWRSGRIVHRNGIRTITIGSYTREGTFPSEVLGQAMPVIDTLTLPAGYRLEYGGEIADQIESFGQMSIALMVSMVSIFLILLFQFKSALDAAVIMVSIPLALFGAFFGLVITGNPFGFTAFMGLIALTGVVVRNAIILIDYIHDKLREGGTLEDAALEAGRRRLRPIFLTTVSAVAGLTPMILSGSGLWSPLASVIASGLVFSMVFTLVVVPVLYVLAKGRTTPSPA